MVHLLKMTSALSDDHEEALWAGTLPPEYCIERIPALLYEQGSIFIHKDIGGLFGRRRLSAYTREHGPLPWPTYPLDEPAPCQGVPRHPGGGGNQEEGVSLGLNAPFRGQRTSCSTVCSGRSYQSCQSSGYGETEPPEPHPETRG